MRVAQRAVEQRLERAEGWGGGGGRGWSGALSNSFVIVDGPSARQAVGMYNTCNQLLQCTHPLVEIFLEEHDVWSV